MSKKKQTGEDEISARIQNADRIFLPQCGTSLTYKQAASLIQSDAKKIVEIEDGGDLTINLPKNGDASFDRTFSTVVHQATQEQTFKKIS